MDLLICVLVALSTTLMIEPIVFSLINKFDLKIFLISTASNIVLNTTMNVLYMKVIGPDAAGVFLFYFEIFTTFAEALLITFICKQKFGKCFLFSMAANVASCFFGLVINSLLLLPLVIIIINFLVYLIFLTLILFYNSNNKEN